MENEKGLINANVDYSIVCKDALETFGKVSQMMMVLEETAELQKEISKNFRGESNITLIAEEIADVEIMLEQMKILFNIREDVEEWKKAKAKRLIQRIEEAKALEIK